jgi:hypothetical protein
MGGPGLAQIHFAQVLSRLGAFGSFGRQEDFSENRDEFLVASDVVRNL